MPAQIPTEATEYFGGLLVPYIPELLTSNASAPFIEWKPSPVIRNVCIDHHFLRSDLKVEAFENKIIVLTLI